MGLKRGTYRTCVDTAIRIIERLFTFHQSRYRVPQRQIFINTVRLDFIFLKILFWGVDYWEVSESDWHLRSAVSTMEHILRQMADQFE